MPHILITPTHTAQYLLPSVHHSPTLPLIYTICRLDWSSLNGITVEHNTSLEKCNPTWAVRNTAFVGATTGGRFGVVAMDTATHNLTG